MSNEAYRWLKEWIEYGESSIEATGDGVVHLRLSLWRSRVSDVFRDDMLRLLNAAERGGIND